MKKWMTDKLICPQCLDAEIPLDLTARETQGDDIIDGEMTCPQCKAIYPIEQGVAVLLPEKTRDILSDHGGYNAPGMLSAYLWSHFGDLLDDPKATQAYQVWSAGFTPTHGDALDVGCAVGRLSFDLAATHDHVIGLDTSIAFIRKAREILTQKEISFDLIVEGHITEPRTYCFDESQDFTNVDFIVADALALPFRERAFATTAAINLLEKVPDPLKHLREINRVMRGSFGHVFVFRSLFLGRGGLPPRALAQRQRQCAVQRPRDRYHATPVRRRIRHVFNPPLGHRRGRQCGLENSQNRESCGNILRHSIWSAADE